jgi:hypothetical protein
MRKVLVIVGILLAFCCTSRADDVSAQFQVNGILTIVGNNACPPLPACAETLDFSFSAYEAPGEFYPYQVFIVPGSGDVESLGPLEEFSLGGGVGNLEPNDYDDSNFVAFDNTNDDEIDIHLSLGQGFSPFTPSVISTDLYGCGTASCDADFSIFNSSGTGEQLGIFRFGEVSATVTPVPEINSASLLAAGLLGLLGLGIVRRRAKQPVPLAA